MKRCGKCKEEKPLEAFCNDASRSDGKSNQCRDCKNIRSKLYRQRYPEKYKEGLRKQYDNYTPKPIIHKNCDICNSAFETKNPHQIYCSKSCRNQSYTYKSSKGRQRFRRKLRERDKKIAIAMSYPLIVCANPYCNNMFFYNYYAPYKKYCTNKCNISHYRSSPDYAETHRQNVKRWRDANPDKKSLSDKKWYYANLDKVAAKNHKRRTAGDRHFTSEDISNKLLEQLGLCYYCCTNISNSYHVEHMIPISRGGGNEPENIVLSCAFCNLSKGSKTAQEFLSSKIL